MLSSGDLLFFDVDEFEDLIDYYSIRNKVDNAFLAINMAKSQHPSSNTFMLKEAELLAFSNKPFEALKTIEKLELIEGPTADITLTKASIFSQQGRYNQAIKTLKDALVTATISSNGIGALPSESKPLTNPVTISF